MSDYLSRYYGKKAIIMEFKEISPKKEKSLEETAQNALKQIKDRDYPQKLRNAGFHKILKYGIACQIKDCKVMLEEE